MLTYARVSRAPAVFRALTGISVGEFDALLREVLPALAVADRARLDRPNRRRALGGGRKAALAPREQVLLQVIWLRRYPTDVVLGFLFGVDEATVRRLRGRVLPVLEQLGRATLHLPDPTTGARPTLDTLLAETPELAVIIDSVEQPIHRPKDRAVADTYYSGKKKRHTRTVQVAIDERDGRIVDLTAGVRGPTADITLLKASGVLDRLDPRVGGLGDLAYVGIATVHPAGLGATPRKKPRGQERPPEDVAFNQAFARRRVKVEHTIRRLRVHACLTEVDRHSQRHGDACALACAGLVNRQLAGRPGAGTQPAPAVTAAAAPRVAA